MHCPVVLHTTEAQTSALCPAAARLPLKQTREGLDRIAFLSGQETDAQPGRVICTARVYAGNSKCSLGGLVQPCFWSPWFQPSDSFPCSFKCLSSQLSA